MVSITEYQSLLEDRPEKFTPEDVEYRDSDLMTQRCVRCVHFFQRSVDQFSTCEIMRPEKDESVDPDYVCNFFTKNGEQFPLYPGSR
jgi:hypothetical protein